MLKNLTECYIKPIKLLGGIIREKKEIYGGFTGSDAYSMYSAGMF